MASGENRAFQRTMEANLEKIAWRRVPCTCIISMGGRPDAPLEVVDHLGGGLDPPLEVVMRAQMTPPPWERRPPPHVRRHRWTAHYERYPAMK